MTINDCCRSPLIRSSRTRRCHTGTAVISVAALLLSTTAWLSLVFSGTTTRCWRRFKDWEGSPHSLPWIHHPRNSDNPPPPPPPPPSQQSHRTNRILSDHQRECEEELSLNHLMFGIAGSSQLWNKRKEFLRLWWRPHEMRGHVWIEEPLPRQQDGDGDNSVQLLPPIIVSEDISRFRYTNPIGHPSGLRISRIVTETFRLNSPNVRWFVLGDDDTIFNPDNLVAVLSKYDSAEMVYIGSPSESHSANSYFSHSMAFGGGGIAISYPLAEALSEIHDECIERYPKLYGSDDRLHACITELGVPLSVEHGFHQWDIRGNAHGLLSSHPITPFISIHHVEAVDPFYPGLTSLESLKLFTKAMRVEPRSILQRSICYDHARSLTFLVSIGYAVQVFPEIVSPRELERSEKTYSAWNGKSNQKEFDFDSKDPYRSICKRPIIFYFKDVEKQGNDTLGFYERAAGEGDLKRRVFCLARKLPLQSVQSIHVLGKPLRKNWHLVPRRLCCKLNQTSDDLLELTVGKCEKGALSSVIDSV